MPEVRPANADAGKALPPGHTRIVPVVARTHVAAARNSALCPPEHPGALRSSDRLGAPRQAPLVNTWERDARGHFPHAVVEAVDPETVQLVPLAYL